MIRIALIDDNPSDIDIGKHYVDTYFQNRPDAANMEISISSYMDGPSFLADFRPILTSFSWTSTCLPWRAWMWPGKCGGWTRA